MVPHPYRRLNRSRARAEAALEGVATIVRAKTVEALSLGYSEAEIRRLLREALRRDPGIHPEHRADLERLADRVITRTLLERIT